MRQFQFDVKRWVLMLLPTFMRKERIRALADALLSPLAAIHLEFMNKRQQHLNRVKYNGQVCYLRGLLNDTFDGQGRRIRIDDWNTTGDWLIIRTEDYFMQVLVPVEGDPWLWLFDESLIIGNTAWFKVVVPWENTGSDRENHMCSLLNEYKLLSKKYIIEYLKNE